LINRPVNNNIVTNFVLLKDPVNTSMAVCNLVYVGLAEVGELILIGNKK